MSVHALPFVSVIIPVYNDAARLALCLAALETQTYPADRYEVIVVDNNSAVPVTEAIGSFSHAHFVREPRPGCAPARVTGIGHARGEILASTDADCIPDSSWIANGVECFLNTPNCGLVGGRIEVFCEEPGQMGAAAILSLATHLKQERFLRNGRWAMFANTFTSRQVMERVGPINPNLMMCEEIEWGQRIHAAGYRQAYAPDAVVRHPARSSIRQHCQRALRHELAWKQLREIAGIGVGVRFWIGQHFIWPMRDTCLDVLRNPHLTLVQKLKATGLACLLIPLRVTAYILMQLGVKFDIRKNWG